MTTGSRTGTVLSADDPRYLRSRAKLGSAIWELASQLPVTEISVAGLCRKAGVTRDTFYRHGTSPAELLATLVRERVRRIAEEAIEDAPNSPNIVANGLLRLLGHITEHADLYRHGTAIEEGAPLQGVLEDAFSETLRRGVAHSPSVLPEELRNDPSGADIAVTYAAAGAVGAVRVWLTTTDLDPDRGARLIMAASPQYWNRNF
ncbi:MAG: TetR/AcrR family transcriptional regulator [Rhodococcus sp. (in: high G+C Gram-positive bacteria)]|uniref:TetR/AcrR family transcriptional regulator n=1 Tax=Rhodococcus sp. TaxID=1831 RepID=UPI003BB76F50